MTSEELEAITIQNTQAIAGILASIEDQGRVNNQAFGQLIAVAESQSRSIESQRNSIGSNAEIMANAMQLAAISQRTAAAAQEQGAVILEISANTTRNIKLLEQNIDRLEKMVEIIIKDNQADRERIRNIENNP